MSAQSSLERWGLVAPEIRRPAPPTRQQDPDGVFECEECGLPVVGFGETVVHMRSHQGGGRFHVVQEAVVA